ncbi:MAG: hypothetical protein M3154_02295 [Candidatus Eremiobacteraeota bacterium]|nr:hypothetical protein [Candidatus Eremiobacteraeota bacterium]
MRNEPIMPVRRGTIATAITLTVALAACLTAAASCPPADRPDAAACDAARPAAFTTALCAADARGTETCADHATGIVHAMYLTRAASEWRKAAMAATRTQGRGWLAHAMVLDERVQDDPSAPAALRARAKQNEQLARTALLR